MRSTLAALLVVSTVVSTHAAPPDVKTLVTRMKKALEPDKAGARRLTLTLSQGGDTTQVTLGEARKNLGNSGRIVLAVLPPAPEGATGTAYLVKEGGPGQDTEWFYLPYVRRVRKLTSPEAYSAFLNSDFTYADLGFVNTGAKYTFLGEGTDSGKKTYKIQAVPKETWYYSRWVTTIDADSGFPIMREIYDPANQLWKRQRWEAATVVDGVPVPSAVSMEDVQAKSRSDLRMTGADFDVDLPESLFDPDQLPAAAAAPIWNTVGK